MALAPEASVQVRRLQHVSLTTNDVERLTLFYQRSFGFRRLRSTRHSGAAFERLMGVAGGAESVVLGLRHESIELLQFDSRGRSYPYRSSADDLLFQHFAIVVTDMPRALAHLATIDGWTATSTRGAQRLPARSGGVTAFKFRDPDGHPLELLAFPAGASAWRAIDDEICQGIDHSAICVADTARSINFYQTLGLRVAARSLNAGIEQQRLDGVPEPCVEVTALTSQQTRPHLELLCYRSVAHAEEPALCSNDVAATRLVLQIEAPPGKRRSAALARRLLDPDGHQLLLV